MTKKRKYKAIRQSLVLLITALVTFSACGYRTEEVETGFSSDEQIQVNTAVPQPTEEPAAKSYTVSFVADGETLLEETVPANGFPSLYPAMYGERSIRAWTYPDGFSAEEGVISDVVLLAELGSRINTEGSFFAADSDGLFHPDNVFTRSDAARAVYAFMGEKPKGETFLADVTTRAKCYASATALVTEGYMDLTDQGRFRPDTAITLAEFSKLLGRMYSSETLNCVLSPYTEADSLTRAEAASVFAELLNGKNGSSYFPDVCPTDACYEAVSFAGQEGKTAWTKEPGYIHLNGYLYCFGEDGYLLKDTSVGTLYFNSQGRYTSGDDSLDYYVANLIDSIITPKMTREEQLRTVYDYVRDHYLYLKRSIYSIGEHGWEIPEALLMFQTGKGNCYNFTGAFWALSRGIGYDTLAYSGLVGVGRDPHSWVEIEFDGIPYIYDVETEMSNRLQGDYYTSMYHMTYERGTIWSYAREPYPEDDNKA